MRFVISDQLSKAGPFVGPRGGKWADAKHTIHWDPKKHTSGQTGLFDKPAKAKPAKTKPAKTSPKKETDHLYPAYQAAKAAIKAGSPKGLVEHLQKLTPEQRATLKELVVNIEPNPRVAIEDALVQVDEDHASRVEAYKEKQEAKRERYEQKAENLKAEAGRRFDAGDLSEGKSGIPMGQPILVGHHSQRKHERAIERANNNMRAGIEAQKKAKHYEQKAASLGTSGISREDPEAVVKLLKQIAQSEETRDQAKAVNASYKKHKGDWEKVQEETGAPAKLIASGKETLRVTPYQTKPFPSYMFTNLGANIRRMQKRVVRLKAEATRPVSGPVEGNGYTMEEDADDSRVRFFFEGKPSAEIRTKLKQSGFRWSPRAGAWQRQNTANGMAAAKRMHAELSPETIPEPPAPPANPTLAAANPDEVWEKLKAKVGGRYLPGSSDGVHVRNIADAAGITFDQAREAADHLVASGKLQAAPSEDWYLMGKALLYTISLRKAQGLPEQLHTITLEKAAAVAGPFIGPRGGKWANPQRTIAWTDRAERQPAAKPDKPTPRAWIDHAPGLPDQTVQKYATVVGRDKAGEPVHEYLGQRKELHDSIIKSFVQGRKPEAKKTAVVMMGGAASGKTSLIKQVMGDRFDTFVNVNPDDVKGQLPEYNAALKASAKDAAWMAHSESSDVAQEVYNQALDKGLNVIVDGTGKNGARHREKIKTLKAEGYEVVMLMPHVDMESAITRIEDRANLTGRFVPTDVAREQYAKIPNNFEASARLADSFKLFDSRGRPPVVKWEGPPDKVHDQAFVHHFQTKGSSPMAKASYQSRWDRMDPDSFIPRRGKRLTYSE